MSPLKKLALVASILLSPVIFAVFMVWLVLSFPVFMTALALQAFGLDDEAWWLVDNGMKIPYNGKLGKKPTEPKDSASCQLT